MKLLIHATEIDVRARRLGVGYAGRTPSVVLPTFHMKDGKVVRVITISDAFKGECSMSDVTVYRIADLGN